MNSRAPKVKKEYSNGRIRTYHSYDGGETWTFVRIEEASRDLNYEIQREEMSRIQKELK